MLELESVINYANTDTYCIFPQLQCGHNAWTSNLAFAISKAGISVNASLLCNLC